jgi:hypothetical protein
MNELVESDVNGFKPVNIQASGNVAIGASRESQEVFGAIMSAKHFPRDKFTAVNNILEACGRYSLAEQAEYKFPRGNQTVSGPTIRLAEIIAQTWGNLDYGVREIERKEDESIMQAYCWDLQTNTRRTMNFTVRHYRDSKAKGKTKLSDERDIYEAVANNGARRLRSCILSIVPGDVTDKAVAACRRTLTSGKDNKTKEDRILEIVRAFSKLGVPQDAIEKRLGHKLDICTDDELADLKGIGNSIKDELTKRTDWFDLGETAQNESTAELNERFAVKTDKKPTREPGED